MPPLILLLYFLFQDLDKILRLTGNCAINYRGPLLRFQTACSLWRNSLKNTKGGQLRAKPHVALEIQVWSKDKQLTAKSTEEVDLISSSTIFLKGNAHMGFFKILEVVLLRINIQLAQLHGPLGKQDTSPSPSPSNLPTMAKPGSKKAGIKESYPYVTLNAHTSCLYVHTSVRKSQCAFILRLKAGTST